MPIFTRNHQTLTVFKADQPDSAYQQRCYRLLSSMNGDNIKSDFAVSYQGKLYQGTPWDTDPTTKEPLDSETIQELVQQTGHVMVIRVTPNDMHIDNDSEADECPPDVEI